MRSHIAVFFTLLITATLASCKSNSTTALSTSPSTTTAGGSAPSVSAISPVFGDAAGGTSVTIAGTGFTGATAVVFGSAIASAFTVSSDIAIVATAPSGTAGTVGDVTVTTSAGTSAHSSADVYGWGQNGIANFVFSPSSAKGGASVTGTITFTYALPAAVTLPLTWQSDPAGSTAFIAPSQVIAPSGASTATFVIPTFFVSTPQRVFASTTYQGVATSANFGITP